MAAWAAEAVRAQERQVLVLSTGIIGAALPMSRIQSGIAAAQAQLAAGSEAVELAARGMLTTDKVPKIAERKFDAGGAARHMLGLAKGAAMIGPNMATMLSVIVTDAPLAARDAQAVLKDAVDVSFNCISVEGHMSTNDAVLLLARGGEGEPPLTGSGLEPIAAALADVCTELAKAIPSDGEGASHLITIDVRGCRTREDAARIARTIADSPLVKTAVHGADPNWGRIVSAAGYAGVEFDPAGLRLELNGTLLYESGTPVAFDAAAVSRSIAENRETSIDVSFREGDASARHWTCDLTAEYVRLNADYHT
jgi:glutamate N-acetyltransferase/amino-acid N-acetyltransferase